MVRCRGSKTGLGFHSPTSIFFSTERCKQGGTSDAVDFLFFFFFFFLWFHMYFLFCRCLYITSLLLCSGSLCFMAIAFPYLYLYFNMVASILTSCASIFGLMTAGLLFRGLWQLMCSRWEIYSQHDNICILKCFFQRFLLSATGIQKFLYLAHYVKYGGYASFPKHIKPKISGSNAIRTMVVCFRRGYSEPLRANFSTVGMQVGKSGKKLRLSFTIFYKNISMVEFTH